MPENSKNGDFNPQNHLWAPYHLRKIVINCYPKRLKSIFLPPFHNTPGHLHLYRVPMPSNSNRQSPTSFLPIPPTSPPLLHHNFHSRFINPTKRAAEKFSTLTALITTIATPHMGNLDKSMHWLLPYSRGVNQLSVVSCQLLVVSWWGTLISLIETNYRLGLGLASAKLQGGRAAHLKLN